MNGEKEHIEKDPGDGERVEHSADPGEDRERGERGPNPEEERSEKTDERAE